MGLPRVLQGLVVCKRISGGFSFYGLGVSGFYEFNRMSRGFATVDEHVAPRSLIRINIDESLQRQPWDKFFHGIAL